jgi:anaerobic magnesium-protoporphyrin IX monomethyl ester cyclase
MTTQNKLDILFINLPSAFGSYDSTKLGVYKQAYPLLSFMSLSAFVKKSGFTTAVLDLGIEENPYDLLRQKLKERRPKFVGITSATPFFHEAVEVAKITKEILEKEATVICGGPHVTALPEESLQNSEIDIVVAGEGEQTLLEIMQNKKLPEIDGIFYKIDSKILGTPPRKFVDNLDSLPSPDFSVYDIKRYHCAKIVSRYSPVLQIETSRGCPHNCSFCNKSIFKRAFRAKSPERVVAEMKYFEKNGAAELRIIDDQFAADIGRAKKICRLLIKEPIKIPWCLPNGIRVDRVDEEFLSLAKQAGCYQVSIGFESGDQDVLDSIDKDISLEQSEKCMKIVKKSGLESIGFFILGLPTDTEKSMKKTIEFAVKMMPTFAKASIFAPYPGSRLFNEYEENGRIKTHDWRKYNSHKVVDLYEHPNLSHETLEKYLDRFYHSFYLNPRFLWMRFFRSLREHTFWRDVYYGARTFLS